MGPIWFRAPSPQKGVDMVTKWNRMRLSAGAVALAVALAAGVPANAAIYKFTFSDQGNVLGSIDVDSISYDSYFDGLGYYYVNFKPINGSSSGYFQNSYPTFNDGSGNALRVYSYNGGMGFDATTSSTDGIGYDYNLTYGEVSPNVLANFNLALGTYDGFGLGTYSLSSIGGYSASGRSFPATTLTIGPAAPAPLAGGGILAGLVSLLGFGFTRFGRRRQALA